MSLLRFQDTLKQRKQFFVTLHKLFKGTHLEGRIFFNCYFGLTKYHIYEESTYPIINKKRKRKKRSFKMGFSTKLKAVTRGPLSEARWRFTFAASCQPGSLWEVPCAPPVTQALSHGRTDVALASTLQ